MGEDEMDRVEKGRVFGVMDAWNVEDGSKRAEGRCVKTGG